MKLKLDMKLNRGTDCDNRAQETITPVNVGAEQHGTNVLR